MHRPDSAPLEDLNGFATVAGPDLSQRKPPYLPLRFFALLIFALGCNLQVANGQVSASIKGVVTDASGAPVAGAQVTGRNIETGAVRNAATDDAGRYQMVWLAIGPYEVKVRKDGFQEAIRGEIRLVIGQEASVNLTLQVSTVKAEVRVSEARRW